MQKEKIRIVCNSVWALPSPIAPVDNNFVCHIYVGRALFCIAYICSILHVWGCKWGEGEEGVLLRAGEMHYGTETERKGGYVIFRSVLPPPKPPPSGTLFHIYEPFPTPSPPFSHPTTPFTLPIRTHMHTHAFMQVRKRGPYTCHCWKDAMGWIDQYYIYVCVSEIAVTHIILMMITW